MYLDDLIVVEDVKFIDKVYQKHTGNFVVSNLGEIKLYLGIEHRTTREFTTSTRPVTSNVFSYVFTWIITNTNEQKTDLNCQAHEMSNKDRYWKEIG